MISLSTSAADFEEDIVIEIIAYDNNTVDSFSATYRKCISTASSIIIMDEIYAVSEREATNIKTNWFKRNYIYDSVGAENIEVFDYLFT